MGQTTSISFTLPSGCSSYTQFTPYIGSQPCTNQITAHHGTHKRSNDNTIPSTLPPDNSILLPNITQDRLGPNSSIRDRRSNAPGMHLRLEALIRDQINNPPAPIANLRNTFRSPLPLSSAPPRLRHNRPNQHINAGRTQSILLRRPSTHPTSDILLPSSIFVFVQ